MNGVKSGFTTLNRLLGKKNKESSITKSTSNLSRSMSQLPTTASSQTQNTYININNSNNNNNNNVDKKILPLQSMSNAPFEQTFRITVQLPRDQLYVARLGAKTPLLVLLKMVCDDKQLDSNKYEFRHPSDMSQAYDNDCTIGYVGLNELKLVLKTEKYQNANSNNFNTEEIFKLRNGGGGNIHANSNNNGSTKTSLVSPYSSTNSLNSIDSSGMMSISSRGGSVAGQHPPIPPSRKKRAAPRPPSQNSIPENKDVKFNNNNNNISNYNNNNNNNHNVKEFKSPLPPTIEHTMPNKKAFHVSSPNLVSNFSISTNNSNETTHIKDIYDDTDNMIVNKHDYNHNIKANIGRQDNRYNSANDLHRVESISSTTHHQRPMSMHIPYQTSTSNRSSVNSNTINMNDNSTIVNHSRTSSESSEQYRDGDKPEPTPRRRLFSGSKKKPPAPQPRGLPPVPTPRFLQGSKEHLNTVEANHTSETIKNADELSVVKPTPVNEKILPEMADEDNIHSTHQNGKVFSNVDEKKGSTIIENTKLSIIKPDDQNDISTAENTQIPSPVIRENNEQIVVTNGKVENDQHSPLSSRNVSKVMLNVEQQQRIIDGRNINKSNHGVDSKSLSNNSSRNSSISVSVNTNAEPNQNSIETNSVNSSDGDDFSIIDNNKMKIESSDDDNDKMEIYNLKLGKSITKTTEGDRLEMNNIKPIEREDINPEIASIRSQSPLWTYTLPAPANFADPSDISSIAVMDNSTIIRDDLSSMMDNRTIISDSTTIDSELINEIIKPVINEKDIGGDVTDEIIRNNSDIEDGYHGGDLENTRKLSRDSVKKIVHNETIENRKNHVIEELNNVINDNTLEKLISTKRLSGQNDIVNSNLTNFKMATYQPSSNEEILQIKRNSITKSSISRSDSFHTTRIEATVKTTELSLPRSSSYLSLNDTGTLRRKSSGSLHESPSLQSLEVMKMILPGLNSANSSKRNSINVNEDEQLLKTLVKRSSISDGIVSSPLKRNSIEEAKLEQKRESIEENEKQVTTINLVEIPKPVAETDKIVIMQTSASDDVVEDSNNKKWTYQGPPAISFSSWSERPKVQVAIKSDRDYKFGGGGGGGGANNRNFNDAETIVEHNNSRNEKERKLPIVRSVEYKKPVVIPLNQENEEVKSPPIILRAKPEIVNKPNFYQTFSRPNTIHINGNYNNSTSNNKFTPFVRGFKTESLNNTTNSNAISIESVVNIPKKSKENVEVTNRNVNNNNTTITKINNNHNNNNYNSSSINNSNSSSNTLPFGQNTLRRTGLKDKILFNENSVKSTSSEMPAQQIHLKQQETVVKSKTIVNSNDLIVDNRNSHNVINNHHHHNNNNNNNNNSTNISVIRSNSRITNVVVSADPPPPPPPIPKLAPVVRSAVIKKSNPVIDVDPHDQLLTAIKSFNRDSLKRS